MSLGPHTSAVSRHLCDVLGCQTLAERQQACQAARAKKNLMQWAPAATNSSRGCPSTWAEGHLPALSTSRRSTQPGALVKIVGMIVRRQPRIDCLSMCPRMEHDCHDAATTCIIAYAPAAGNVENGQWICHRRATSTISFHSSDSPAGGIYFAFQLSFNKKAATLMGLRSLL